MEGSGPNFYLGRFFDLKPKKQQNPYWGTLEETFRKVGEYYKAGRIHQTDPVEGAREGIQALKDMGFRLIIVTARLEDAADESWEWVTKHFPGKDLSGNVPPVTDKFRLICRSVR